MYTFEQLKDDVRKEAEALKNHATSEERGRLDIDTLQPSNTNHCIYGQMAQSCDSYRGIELIKSCAPIFFSNGSTSKDLITRNSYGPSYWSPIELYILKPEAKNANLIAFLRGETETLEL